MNATRPEKYHLTPYHPVEVPDLVRVGRPEDGGYVICAQVLERTKLLLSGGIYVDWSFEADFLSRAGSSRLLAFDGSVSGRLFLLRAVVALAQAIRYTVLFRRPLFQWYTRGVAFLVRLARQFFAFFRRPDRHFEERFLGATDSGKTVSWATIRKMAPVASVEGEALGICWKLDIEGSEYEFLPTILRDAHLFNSLIVEFHSLDSRWDEFESLMQTIMKDFAVIHLHGNNFAPLISNTSCPSVLEVTFLNRSLLPAVVSPIRAALPRAGLDFSNNPAHADYAIEL